MSVNDDPIPGPASNPEGNPCDIEIKLKHLATHKFELSLSYLYPRLVDVFPKMREYRQAPPKKLTAFFILCPMTEVGDETLSSSYFYQAEISERDMLEIQKVSPKHIVEIKGTDWVIKEGNVFCCYHSWVSLSFHTRIQI